MSASDRDGDFRDDLGWNGRDSLGNLLGTGANVGDMLDRDANEQSPAVSSIETNDPNAQTINYGGDSWVDIWASNLVKTYGLTVRPHTVGELCELVNKTRYPNGDMPSPFYEGPGPLGYTSR